MSYAINTDHPYSLSQTNLIKASDKLFEDIIHWSLESNSGLSDHINHWYQTLLQAKPLPSFLWGSNDPANTAAIKRYHDIIEETEKIQNLLIETKWQDAKKQAQLVLKMIHETPYPQLGQTIKKLSQLMQLSYGMVEPSISDNIFKFLSSIPSQTKLPFNLPLITLVFTDINLQLLTSDLALLEEPVSLEMEDEIIEKWYHQIEFWAIEWFSQDGIKHTKSKSFRNDIRDWLVRAYEPKDLIIQLNSKQTISIRANFKQAPIPYIFAIFDTLFDINPRHQILEDANHRTGSTLINYLLARHLGIVDLSIYLHNYGKGRKRPYHTFFHSTQDAVPLTINHASLKFLAREKHASNHAA